MHWFVGRLSEQIAAIKQIGDAEALEATRARLGAEQAELAPATDRKMEIVKL